MLSKRSKSVSLVLGSGGARGIAHIGVIRWLEENGYVIASISGSSIGALIGGIYAAGKLNAYAEWVQSLRKNDVRQLLDFAFSRAGIFSGDRIMRKLQELIGDTEIENLPVSFTAVASDLDTGREVWLNSGSLFDAIRASMAIPTIFTPVVYQGHLLVDGGLLNPVPIAPTLKDVTDYTIAVNLSGKDMAPSSPKPKVVKPKLETNHHTAIRQYVESFLQEKLEEKKDNVNIFDIMSRSLESVEHVITRFKLAAYNPDFLIEIPKNACGVFEFYRATEMIERGYQTTAKELASLRPT